VLQEILERLESVKEAVSQDRDNLQKDVNQYNTIKQLHTGITDTKNSANNLERIRNRLTKYHEVVHELRINFTDNVLDAITTEADRLFQQIHPGEHINLSALKMDSTQRASVLQTGTFHGQESILPQAVFSESHMDTLGFCVWLALALHE